MEKSLKRILSIVLSISIVVSLGSCKAIQNANNTQKGGTIGAGAGAILGAILGNNVGKGGNGELGAVIGGVLGGVAGGVIGKRMDKQAQKIENEIPGAEVKRIDDAIIVTFDENQGGGIRFATNKSDIDGQSQETLGKLANVLNEFPDTNLLIVGHTDSSGADSYNLTLSKKRAKAVSGFLKSNQGVDDSRLTVKWYGEEQPIADNTTPEGRAKNRRVNIVIVPNEKMKEDAKKEAGQN